MDELVHNAELSASLELLADPSVGIPTFKLIGELDIASVGPIRPAVDAIVADKPERVVIDLSELRFMDSSGLSLLLAVAHQVPEVELRHPSAMIRKVIDLTGVSSLFVITP